MPSFQGKYRYLDPNGAAVQEASCQLTLEGDSLLLTPGLGAPLACDLGDIDVFSPGEYELTLKFYNGRTILLTHFGKAFQNLHRDLLEAYRKRLVQCLLLEDLEEIERFDGWAQLASSAGGFSSRAEIRLYRSNLAILPETATGFSWRLADIDYIDFDDATYTLGLRSGPDRLILTRLAKRTREFLQRLQDATTGVAETGARTIRSIFPFLSPDQFQRVTGLLKEGRAVAMAQLNAIHPQIERALLARAVDVPLKVYHDYLRGLSPDRGYFAGFKQIRKEAEEAPGPDEAANQAEESPAEESPSVRADRGHEEEGEILHWFFFPLKSNAGAPVPADVIAWEAASRSGRATYFFRVLPPASDDKPAGDAVAAAVRELNHAIVMLNFRREPIYLSDDSLQMEERFRRYAIACRRLPALKKLRASFLGRALHTSPEAWQKQVGAILARV